MVRDGLASIDLLSARPLHGAGAVGTMVALVRARARAAKNPGLMGRRS